MSELKAFEQLRESPVDRSRAFARRMITLPLFPDLPESHVEEICDVIKQTVKGTQLGVGAGRSEL